MSLGALAALLGAGCMASEHYTEAITGRTPPVAPPVVDAEVDAPPPPRIDLGRIDLGMPDFGPPPEVCDGIDQDGDGRVDEGSPTPPGVRCCPGEAGPPCHDAAPGTLLPEGWVKVPERGSLVMAAPFTRGQWRALEDIAGLLPPRDGATDGDPVRGIRLSDALALANAWSCAHGRLPCHLAGGSPIELGATPDAGARLSRVPSCEGAHLFSVDEHRALTDEAPGDVCAACEGASPTAAEQSMASATGVVGLVEGREWVWPAAAEVDPSEALTGAGCGYEAPCGRAAARVSNEVTEVFEDWGLRLVCPIAPPGEENPCTIVNGGGACTEL